MRHSDVGRLLAVKRKELGISQLELALRLGMSQRHLGFVETGRSHASRPLLATWMAELGFETSEANAAFLKAGFPPGGVSATAAPSEDVVTGMTKILQAHEPFPAFIFDAGWVMVRLNEGGQRLCELLMPELWRSVASPESGLDMIEAMIDARGLFSQMDDAATIAAELLRQLRIEQVLRPSLGVRIDRLEERLVADFELGAVSSVGIDAGRPLELCFSTALGKLRFIKAQLVTGLPQDALPASLRMEVWFPSDRFTKNRLSAIRS